MLNPHLYGAYKIHLLSFSCFIVEQHWITLDLIWLFDTDKKKKETLISKGKTDLYKVIMNIISSRSYMWLTKIITGAAKVINT